MFANCVIRINNEYELHYIIPMHAYCFYCETAINFVLYFWTINVCDFLFVQFDKILQHGLKTFLQIKL